MARLHRDAMARGAVPARTREPSSAYVVSLTWWILFKAYVVAREPPSQSNTGGRGS